MAPAQYVIPLVDRGAAVHRRRQVQVPEILVGEAVAWLSVSAKDAHVLSEALSLLCESSASIFLKMRDDLTVGETADALGTSPQTVRTLLRTGELRGRKQRWGNRYVWVPSRKGVDDFLSQYGRLDGHRRRRRPPGARRGQAHDVRPVTALRPLASPTPDPYRDDDGYVRQASGPFFLRPRGRATFAVVVLGVPLLVAYVGAQFLVAAVWFDELGHLGVLGRTLAARAALFVLAGGAAAVVIAANLEFAVSRANVARTRGVAVAIAAVTLMAGSYFGSSASERWQTFLLWRHRQSFGHVDPLHGKDVGFFVFTLPFELAIVRYLFLLATAAALSVTLVYWGRGAISFRPLRLTYDAQVHLAGIGSVLLLVLAWRLHLARYAIELGQPSPVHTDSFAGAGYVDVHIRSPVLTGLSISAVLLAFVCLAAPAAARRWYGRRATFFVRVLAVSSSVGVIFVVFWLPALVQRYGVDPNRVLSEQPFLQSSIAATRAGLGLDRIDVESYSPTGRFSAAEISPLRARLANVAIWDPSLLEARMRQLVSDTPYYESRESTYDVVRRHGRRKLTIASARELDTRRVRGARTWTNNRLAYTHGLGLTRFSGTDVRPNRQPRLLDAGLGVRQPRIYFGDLPRRSASWVVANTRRAEVDIPAADGPETRYHYNGTGGIELSSRILRAAFALELGSKELLLSNDITPEARLLLHRDVRDRLHTLAPFIRWDRHPTPLAFRGRILFVIDGYTTSADYPYAERVALGGAQVNYARASVRATVDAFTGQVSIYLCDEFDPIARAWAEAFPALFRAHEEMPAKLRARLRYPADLFAVQATKYERFHETRPDRFASEADAWARPISLSGSLEVAGDVDFDESDEDDLRAQMKPGYKFSPPPGRTRPALLLETYYSPRRGQNLVGTLSGWIDERGGSHLAARSLPRHAVTLGPAQVSRLVFATPRVSNLLGLRNLEIRDLDKSSLDSVVLGNPHLLFLPGGVLQIQSLYEGSRGPGAARLLGVTAFLNGRAGLGPNIYGAVRQALNKPPRIDVLPPDGPVSVGQRVGLRFDVENAERETIAVTSSAGRQVGVWSLRTGRGTAVWVASAPGLARARVEVTGLDGTVVADSTAFQVLGPAPTIRVASAPTGAVVGIPVRLSFHVTRSVGESARVSTRAGIEFSRHYLIRDGSGVVEWTPETAGPAELRIRVRGSQGQTATKTLHIAVSPAPRPRTPSTRLARKRPL